MLGLSYASSLSPRLESELATLFILSPSRVEHLGDPYSLNSDQAKVAMGEVHEGICGTHQLAPKMKWLLRRASFYWPSMILDCFRYYKGCEEFQRFGDL